MRQREALRPRLLLGVGLCVLAPLRPCVLLLHPLIWLNNYRKLPRGNIAKRCEGRLRLQCSLPFGPGGADTGALKCAPGMLQCVRRSPVRISHALRSDPVSRISQPDDEPWVRPCITARGCAFDCDLGGTRASRCAANSCVRRRRVYRLTFSASGLGCRPLPTESRNFGISA